MIWHSCDADSVINELKSDREVGLDSSTVLSRLEHYGKNELHDFEVTSFWKVLLSRIRDYRTVVLFAVALIFMIVCIAKEGGWTEPFMIMLAVASNCFIGSFVNYRNLKKVDGLRNSHIAYTTVIRDGVEQVIPSANLVPGDIMLLSSGDFIWADGRIVDSYVFICDEFSVNGEAVPVEKSAELILDDITPLSKRTNMVYAGSYVGSGKATVIVTETGDATAIGRAESIKKQTATPSAPLFARLSNIQKTLGLISLIAAIAICLAGIIANIKNYSVGFETTVLTYLLLGLSVTVSAIPDGLPTVFTTAVSFAALRLQNRNLTFLNLPMTESIGGTSVICTDKTGVLTDDNNNLVKLWNGKKAVNLAEEQLAEADIMLLQLSLICSNLNEYEHIERHSNAIELAIERACIRATGMSKIDIDGIYPRLAELPFDSKRMLMTTVTVINTKPYAVIKGAPEIVLSRCTDANAEEVSAVIDSFADEGLKVLAVALKPLGEIPANPTADELENGLVLVGLLGFDNPTEPMCIKEIAECKKKNIRVIMVTGDYKKTSVAVARELGIIESDQEAIDHSELSMMSDEELFDKVSHYSVFTRATAEDKLRIVLALQKTGEQVLLTCDDVNDVTSLTAADFGCALGATSSESVKMSADFIVDDNKFTTLTLALKESNRVFDSVLRSVKYTICCTAAQIALLLIGIIAFGASPVTASAIIWFNLIINLLPSIAFSLEPASSTLSLRRHESRELLSISSTVSTAVPILLTVLLGLIAYAIGLKDGPDSAATLTFAVLSICQTVLAFSLSHTYTVFQKGTVKNLVMPIACLTALVILLITVLTPLGALFSLTIPKISGLGYILMSAVLTLAAGELTKFIQSKM